ncbi:MAG TPA: hypothetical protein VIH11_06455 [Gemmatimonadaceae bacterium]|nr:hypothetical protein [Gemmatimonadaceae bacterium]
MPLDGKAVLEQSAAALAALDFATAVPGFIGKDPYAVDADHLEEIRVVRTAMRETTTHEG